MVFEKIVAFQLLNSFIYPRYEYHDFSKWQEKCSATVKTLINGLDSSYMDSSALYML
jgi:lysine/ornithine N-monooxygenase